MMLDKVIKEADFALKLLTTKSLSKRKVPELKSKETPHPNQSWNEKSIRLMRVNHTGEICAQGLYRGQLFFNKDPIVEKELKRAASEETDHLVWCENRIHELGGKTSILNPIFYSGSLFLGAISSLIDSKYNLGFLEETEKQVTAHLEEYIEKLPDEDQKSREILKQMHEDEERHQQTAKNLGARPLPINVKKIMGIISKFMTKSTYWI
ncbi:MAG: 2-polyprenyl-3-methyl-6-methoxy-1,4-benzoquinone monooxygenase [Nitrosomonadales bacterium]|jgi:ubiquinone biosynthesis monooxygenase Coq7